MAKIMRHLKNLLGHPFSKKGDPDQRLKINKKYGTKKMKFRPKNWYSLWENGQFLGFTGFIPRDRITGESSGLRVIRNRGRWMLNWRFWYKERTLVWRGFFLKIRAENSQIYGSNHSVYMKCIRSRDAETGRPNMGHVTHFRLKVALNGIH